MVRDKILERFLFSLAQSLGPKPELMVSLSELQHVIKVILKQRTSLPFTGPEALLRKIKLG